MTNSTSCFWTVGNITTTGRRLDRENLTEHILEVRQQQVHFVFKKERKPKEGKPHLVSIVKHLKMVSAGERKPLSLFPI